MHFCMEVLSHLFWSSGHTCMNNNTLTDLTYMTVTLHLATCNTPDYSLLKLHTPDMKQDIHNHAEVDFIIDAT